MADGHRPSRISQEPLVTDYDILTVQSEPEVSMDFSASRLHGLLPPSSESGV